MLKTGKFLLIFRYSLRSAHTPILSENVTKIKGIEQQNIGVKPTTDNKLFAQNVETPYPFIEVDWIESGYKSDKFITSRVGCKDTTDAFVHHKSFEISFHDNA